MKELEKFVTLKEHNSDNLSILYFDFNDNHVKPFTKTLEMYKTDKSKVKDLLIKKIIKLSSIDKEMVEKFSLVEVLKEYKDRDESALRRRVLTKIIAATNYIATYGRIGMANTVLISKDNYDKFKMSEIIENCEIFFDDSVEDVYVYRRNEIDQPGLILVYNENKYELCEIGFYPERQFMKITLK